MNSLEETSKLSRKTTKRTKARKEAAKRKPRIKIGEIEGVIGWGNRRNPLSRSNRSYKSGMTLSTSMFEFQPSLILNDSEIEEAFKIDAFLQPHVVGIECQPLTIPLPSRTAKGRGRSHTFDVRITLQDGKVYLVYVKAQTSLRSSSSVPTIAEIIKHTPRDACHRVTVVSDAVFSRNYRDNNRRILMCHEMPDPEADQRIRDLIDAENAPLRLSTLIYKSGLIKAQAWCATMRMIGAGHVGTERDAVIDYPSVIWRP